jgi:hypothetical protein
MVYHSDNKLELALQNYQKAQIIYEKEKGKNSIDCADSLSNIASVYDMEDNV